ncbi:hypothetical protein HaLaN_00179 [Haematococcus lacustris]|uniref:Uncharacterized protein n=1 Tax=Haematococcus lacustris TaxID=44745 RepID=A0A699Y631_HAELA|nr:hypothetical protein HaLaN_00179 [Haematococcus lacustris]
MLMPGFEDPSNQELLAKLQELGSIDMRELQAATLDKEHVADLIEEANKHRCLLGMKKQGRGIAEQREFVFDPATRALEQFLKKLEEDMAEVSVQRHGRPKQLVVFFGAAGIGTGGGMDPAA